MKRILLLICAAFQVLGPSLQAQTDSLKLDEVVITGQHNPVLSQKSIYRIKVLDRKRIEAQAANNLADLMLTELGTNLYQDPVLGSVMQLQGISGENIKVLIDGIPVIGRLGGELDLSQLPLNQVERIEIIEGPMSVEYGTNALGGVINLITKKSGVNSWEADLSAYESNVGRGHSIYEGFHNQGGGFSLNQGRHQISLNGGRNFFGGSYSEKDIRQKQFNPKRQVFGSAGYGWSGKKLNLALRSELFDEVLIRKSEVFGAYIPKALDEHYRTLRRNQKLQASYLWSDRTQLKGNLGFSYYERNKNVYAIDLTNLEQNELMAQRGQDGFTAWTSRSTLSHHWAALPLSMQLGYDINLESASGGKIQDGTQTGNDLALFASAEYQPSEKLVLRPGLRLTYNSLYQAPLSPSIHLKYSPAWGQDLRFSYARGFRAPSLKELFFEFIDVNHLIIGNPELKAEYSHNFQVSGNWKKLVENHLINLEIAGFYNRIKNKIDLALTGTSDISASYFNVDEVEVSGVQAKIGLRNTSFQLTLGGALLGRGNRLDGLDDASLPPFNLSTNAQVNFSWNIFQTGLTLSTFYKYTGAVQGFRTNASETELELESTNIAAYQMADVSLQKHWLNQQFTTVVGVKNLFNVSQIAANTSGAAHSGGSGSTLVGFGRNFFLQLNLKLKGN